MTHYDTLGVSKDANETEIKKAYRALSLQYHPDRNSSPDAKSKFQEINDAYETLSDPEKKTQYDNELNGIPAFDSHTVEINPDDLNNIFSMMFGGGIPGMHGGGIHVQHGFPGMPGMHFFHAQMQKPVSIIKTIEITMEQSYTGYTCPFEFERFTMSNGMKISELTSATIELPAGIPDNEIVIMQNCGNQINEQIRGDVKLVIKIVNNTPFIRKDMNLEYTHTVSLREALTGFSFELKHLNGRPIHINNLTNKTIIYPGYSKTLNGLGMQRNGLSGNLIIHFNIQFPEKLTDEQIEGLKTLLGEPAAPSSPEVPPIELDELP